MSCYHRHSQPYRPPAVYATTRRPWWLRLVIMLVLAAFLALAAFGLARMVLDFAHVDQALQVAHDEGVDQALRLCGVQR